MPDNIPKMIPANAIDEGTVPWKTLIVSGIIFGIMLIITAVIALGYKPILATSIKRNETRIAELDSVAPKAETEAKFIRFYSQLSNISILLSSHTSLIPVFDAFEANTMDRVGLVSMSINVEDRRIDVSALADSFETLAGQIALYENISGADKITLYSSALTDKLINFKLKGEFSPVFFKFTPVIKQQIEQSTEQAISSEQ